MGLWQGALRDTSDPRHGEVAQAIEGRQPLSLELLYTDQVGAQPTITRFTLIPSEDRDDPVSWLSYVGRHWYLDRAGPR